MSTVVFRDFLFSEMPREDEEEDGDDSADSEDGTEQEAAEDFAAMFERSLGGPTTDEKLEWCREQLNAWLRQERMEILNVETLRVRGSPRGIRAWAKKRGGDS